MRKLSLLGLVLALFAGCSHSSKTVTSTSATADQYTAGAKAIRQMAGCFLVDYNYVETEGLKKGYTKDNRVYDVTRNKNVKEWIALDEVSPNRLRLQHVLFFTDAQGKLVEGSQLKHQTEDWEFGAHFLYDFNGNATWKPVNLDSQNKTWLRRITNLDEGLRYQCAAAWKTENQPQDWVCDNYSPIPGRETRDMKRSDYQTLQRSTRVIVYGDSWLERQDNIKTIHNDKGRTPLAKELGKNWYVRLPDSDCAEIRTYAAKNKDFWNLLRDTWDTVLASPKEFKEKKIKDAPPRFMKISEVQDKYPAGLPDKATYTKAQTEVLQIIEQYRETN